MKLQQKQMIRETAVEINKKMLPLKDDGFYQVYKEKLTPTTHRLQINRKGITSQSLLQSQYS